jgi:hypothetical protein
VLKRTVAITKTAACFSFLYPSAKSSPRFIGKVFQE